MSSGGVMAGSRRGKEGVPPAEPPLFSAAALLLVLGRAPDGLLLTRPLVRMRLVVAGEAGVECSRLVVPSPTTEALREAGAEGEGLPVALLRARWCRTRD